VIPEHDIPTSLLYELLLTLDDFAGKHHKNTTCNRLQDRITLYRVADTAQKLFYIAEELTWSALEIEDILKRGDSLILRANVSSSRPQTFPLTHFTFLQSLRLLTLTQYHRDVTWPKDSRVFPSHLVPLKEDREAVLSFLGCIIAGGWMIEFVGGLLHGK
jgi:hypothetical protein